MKRRSTTLPSALCKRRFLVTARRKCAPALNINDLLRGAFSDISGQSLAIGKCASRNASLYVTMRRILNNFSRLTYPLLNFLDLSCVLNIPRANSTRRNGGSSQGSHSIRVTRRKSKNSASCTYELSSDRDSRCSTVLAPMEDYARR